MQGSSRDIQGAKDGRARRLRVGTRLLANAYAGDGVLLLRAGATVQSFSELIRLNEPDVTFGETHSKDIPFDTENEAKLDEAEAARKAQVAAFEKRVERAKSLKQEAVADVREVFSRLEGGDTVDLDCARNAVSGLVSELLDDHRAIVSLTDVKNTDEYTYTHCVNVGILTMHLAMHTGYRDKVEEIGLGAILHDVGKVKIPLEILNKPGPLDQIEMNVMKSHPVIGADRVRASGETRDGVIQCVLSHHEKMNGEGYPNGKRGRQLSPHAMLTAISDVYDALTTNRPYRRAMSPKGAMLLMSQKMVGDFPENLLQCFISMVGFYPVGTDVELSSGCIAKVLTHHAASPERPTVLLVSDREGKPCNGATVVELSQERAISIVRSVMRQPQIEVEPKRAPKLRKAA